MKPMFSHFTLAMKSECLFLSLFQSFIFDKLEYKFQKML